MKKIILVLIGLVLVTGCATTWDTQRKELKSDYDSGKISAEKYFELKAKIDKEELSKSDPYGALLLDLEELYKANKISASEYIQEKEKITTLKLEKERLDYEDSQKIAESIRQMEKERQEQAYKNELLKIEAMKAAFGGGAIPVRIINERKNDDE